MAEGANRRIDEQRLSSALRQDVSARAEANEKNKGQDRDDASARSTILVEAWELGSFSLARHSDRYPRPSVTHSSRSEPASRRNFESSDHR